MTRAAIFLDRDGVINENRADYVKTWEECRFLPGIFEPLRRLAQSPFAIVITSNQSVINRGIVARSEVEEINRRMIEEIQANGGRIDAVFYCPHRPDENCDCRKPEPGLLLQAAECLNLDLRRSYLIGDAASDIKAAVAAGCYPILVLTGRGKKQLPLLQDEGYSGYHVASNLQEAVEWILARQGESQGRGIQMTRRNVGLILIIAGIVALLAAVTADLTGIGGQPGFGWKQMVGTSVGVIVAIIGGILCRS